MGTCVRGTSYLDTLLSGMCLHICQHTGTYSLSAFSESKCEGVPDEKTSEVDDAATTAGGILSSPAIPAIPVPKNRPIDKAIRTLYTAMMQRLHQTRLLEKF